MDEIMNEELALVEVDSISDALSTFIEQGTETVINVFTSNEAVRQLFAAGQSLYEEYANFVLENNESPQAALKGLSAILRARGL